MSEADAGPRCEDSVQGLGERLDARLQGVNARFTTMDRRFTSVTNRVDEIENVVRSLAERHDRDRRAAEASDEAMNARIDLVHDSVVMQHDRTRREMLRLLLVGLAVATSINALVAVGIALIASG